MHAPQWQCKINGFAAPVQELHLRLGLLPSERGIPHVRTQLGLDEVLHISILERSSTATMGSGRSQENSNCLLAHAMRRSVGFSAFGSSVFARRLVVG